MAGEEFMIGSPQQLAEVLFVKLGLSRKRRGKTGFSTDARVLQAIRDEHPIIPKIERFRELTKLVQTYLDALPAWIGDDGRLHTTFLQTNAATGRLASINPNLQNIPIRTETGRVIRRCFVAEPGNVLTSVDYEQVELRVLAHIADEQVLRDIFLRGEDVHTETASKVFELPPEQLDVGMRSKAKMVNYGIVYGPRSMAATSRACARAERLGEVAGGAAGCGGAAAAGAASPSAAGASSASAGSGAFASTAACSCLRSSLSLAKKVRRCRSAAVSRRRRRGRSPCWPPRPWPCGCCCRAGSAAGATAAGCGSAGAAAGGSAVASAAGCGSAAPRPRLGALGGGLRGRRPGPRAAPRPSPRRRAAPRARRPEPRVGSSAVASAGVGVGSSAGPRAARRLSPRRASSPSARRPVP